MKRVGNLYNKICDLDVIMDMYDNSVRKNTKNRKKIQRFDDFYSCNLLKIRETLMKKDYKPQKYNIFLVYEPKLRIIMSQEIEDKIINHLVAKYFLIDIFDKNMLDRNCATRIGKGTHYALKLFKKDYNYYFNKYGEFYILKMDISKYFYNLDHEIIKNLVRHKIKDKNVLKLIDTIIDSTNEKYINEEIIKLKNSEKKKILNTNTLEKQKRLDDINKLSLYEKGKGVCIGNIVSQIVATFYLDELDKYIERELNIKAHTRYMDDFYCMSESKEYLKKCLIKIQKFLLKYKLELNQKTKIYKSNESVEFLGFMFLSNKNIKVKLTNKAKKKFITKMKIKNKELNNKEINFAQYKNIISSYKAHFSFGNCNYLYKKYVY